MNWFYKKGSPDQISPHFKAREFDCPCSQCSSTLIESELLTLLNALRDTLGTTVKITSGYRCEAHQRALRAQGYETAVGISTHELGQAADIEDGVHTGEQLEKVARAIGFRSVGVGKGWVHVDTRSDKIRRWTYSY